ncbi:MAG: adenylyl-sulfate kinase [Bacteroidetes bacterium]|nr:adenylyl-sulfate kinase [Bacteroidota bacterium]
MVDSDRTIKQALLKQRGKVLWLTGLSSAGKTSLALLLQDKLLKMGHLTQVIDGDILRHGLNKDLGFSLNAREENIRRVSEVAKLFVNSGIITICCFISPTREIRKLAGEIIGKDDFIEVFVNASLETCEKRDVKGLYKKARSGMLPDFTGIDSPYEFPENPDLEVKTDQEDLESCTNLMINYLIPLITNQ